MRKMILYGNLISIHNVVNVHFFFFLDFLPGFSSPFVVSGCMRGSRSLVSLSKYEKNRIYYKTNLPRERDFFRLLEDRIFDPRSPLSAPRKTFERMRAMRKEPKKFFIVERKSESDEINCFQTCRSRPYASLFSLHGRDSIQHSRRLPSACALMLRLKSARSEGNDIERGWLYHRPTT